MTIPATIQSISRRLFGSTYWRDVAWLASGSALAQLINVAAMPVFSRLFEPRDFAVLNLFVQFVTAAAIISTLRFELLVQLPEREDDGWRMVQLVAAFGATVSIVFTPVGWTFRSELAAYAGNRALAPWLVLVPVSAWLMSLGTALQAWEQRRRYFRRSAEADVAGRVAQVGVVLGGRWLLPGGGGLVAGFGLGATLGKVLWLARRGRWLTWAGAQQYLSLTRRYRRLSGSLVVSHTLLTCTMTIPLVFISHAYGADALGQYGLAYQVVWLPSSLLGTAIGNVYYQRASERWSQGRSFSDVWRATLKRLFLIGLPVYGIAIVSLPWLFPLVFGGAWHLAGRLGAILAVASFFGFITTPMDRACLVVGAWWYVPMWHGARALSVLLVAWVAEARGWTIQVAVPAFAAQQVLMYLIDGYAEWRFSRRSPARATAA